MYKLQRRPVVARGSGRLAAVEMQQSAASPARARVSRVRSFANVAWRALLAARKPLHAEALPPLAVSLREVGVEPAQVARYREVCGARPEGPVPPGFPYLLAGPAQMTLLTHRDFPLRVLGTVHLRNRSCQVRPLVPGERVSIQVLTGGLRETPHGAEYQLHAEVTDAESVVVWTCESTYLVVDRSLPRGMRGAAIESPAFGHVEPVLVPANVGRRYGSVSGDLNPIHLHPVLARLFGFPRAVAHGMWTLGRSLAALESRLPGGSMVVDVSFRRPLLIPATVALRWSDGGEETRFAVTSGDGMLTHAEGTVGRAQE